MSHLMLSPAPHSQDRGRDCSGHRMVSSMKLKTLKAVNCFRDWNLNEKKHKEQFSTQRVNLLSTIV